MTNWACSRGRFVVAAIAAASFLAGVTPAAAQELECDLVSPEEATELSGIQIDAVEAVSSAGAEQCSYFQGTGGNGSVKIFHRFRTGGEHLIKGEPVDGLGDMAGVAPGKLYVLLNDRVLEVSGFSVEEDALVDLGKTLVERLEP